MESSQGQGSQVTRLLAQIQQEYEAAQLGLSGLAYGTSKHEFITQKMENVGKLQEQLQTIVGEMPAIALIVEQLNACPERKSLSVP